MNNSMNLYVALDELKPNQVKALSAYIATFADSSKDIEPAANYSFDKPQPNLEPEKKTRAKKGSTVQAGAMKDQERTESVVDEYEEAKNLKVEEPTDAEDNTLSATMDEVRSAASDKMPEHRDALKNKIIELGGTKIADLPEKNYTAFISFAKSL
jgi:hypothetical protein